VIEIDKAMSIASGVLLRQSITSGSPVVGCTAGVAAIAKLKLNKVKIPMKRHFLANTLFLLIIVLV